MGYRILSHYLEQEATATLEVNLDNNNYDETELLEIRVPLKLPYQTNWKEFERIDGEVELNGIHYQYVKRKVSNGEMILLCLPNKAKMNLQTARDEFFMLVNDLQHSGNGKDGKSTNSVSIKNPVSEYRQENNEWAISGLLINQTKPTGDPVFLYQYIYSTTPEQPPEILG